MNLPSDTFISVTWRCNARCIMCDAWKRSPTEELAPREYAKLPRSLKFINITGGEPFLRDDLPQVIKVIHERTRGEIAISTNGLAVDKIERLMRDILRLKANVRVMVSIDGIGERHNQVRGIRDAFDKAMRTVEALKRLDLKRLGLAYVATNSNIDQLMPLTKLAKAMKVDFTNSSYASNSHISLGKENPSITDIEEFKSQNQQYVCHQLKTYSITNWARAFIASGNYYYVVTGKRKIPCSAGSAWFYLTPEGDIYPDMLLDYKLGNIKLNSFEEIWCSQPAEDFRKSIEETGYCSTPCWVVCTVFPWMRKHKLNCAIWLIKNKIKVHLGLPIKPVQG